MMVFVILVTQGLYKGEEAGAVWSLQPFIGQNTYSIPIITGTMIVCFSFLGSDAVTTLSEEAPDVVWVTLKAISLIAMYGGIISVAASFFMRLFSPDIYRFKDPDVALSRITLCVGDRLFQSIFLCTAFVNTLTSGLASHTSVSHLLCVMGCDNVFPEHISGCAHPKWRTSVLNVIIVGIVALSALLFDLVTVTTLISFSALVASTFVNSSVFNHFWRHKGYNKI